MKKEQSTILILLKDIGPVILMWVFWGGLLYYLIEIW